MADHGHFNSDMLHCIVHYPVTNFLKSLKMDWRTDSRVRRQYLPAPMATRVKSNDHHNSIIVDSQTQNPQVEHHFVIISNQPELNNGAF